MVTAFTSHIIPLQGVGNSMQGGRPENQDDWGCMDTPLDSSWWCVTVWEVALVARQLHILRKIR